MQIFVNGEPRDVPEGTTVAGLLDLLGYANRRVAVEVNRDIVPRSEHAERRLQDNDRAEIVHAIGGG